MTTMNDAAERTMPAEESPRHASPYVPPQVETVLTADELGREVQNAAFPSIT